jgi:pyruvate/2-oxoglutarate dehydrogenase complex dihydrolipoamide acyltransferase (E2) component
VRSTYPRQLLTGQPLTTPTMGLDMLEGNIARWLTHESADVAIALTRGLIVPAILNGEFQSLGNIKERSKGLAQHTVNSTLQQTGYSGIFNISTLTMCGNDWLPAPSWHRSSPC